MKKSKKLSQRRAQSNKLSHEKHPPLSVEHSAEYLLNKATTDATKNKLPINIRFEHVRTMIILSKVEPCFAVLVMKHPDNGYLLGNVSIRSIV